MNHVMTVANLATGPPKDGFEPGANLHSNERLNKLRKRSRAGCGWIKILMIQRAFDTQAPPVRLVLCPTCA